MPTFAQIRTLTDAVVDDSVYVTLTTQLFQVGELLKAACTEADTRISAVEAIQVQDKSAAYVITVDDDLIRNITGNNTYTLPDATTAKKPVAIRSLANTSTINVANSGTVDGSASTTITAAKGKIFYPARSSNRWDTLAQF